MEKLKLRKTHDGHTGKPQIFKLSLPSVLRDVKAFLPQMKTANDELFKAMSESDAPSEFSMENTAEIEGKVIEMDIVMYEDDNSSEDETSQSYESVSSQDSDDGAWSEITEKSIKLKITDVEQTEHKPIIEEMS